MTEPSYEDFYPTTRQSPLTEAEEREYAALTGAPPPPDPPDALTLLTQASAALAAGNHYPKDHV